MDWVSHGTMVKSYYSERSNNSELISEVKQRIKSNYGLIYETLNNGNLKCDFAKTSSMCSLTHNRNNVEDAWNWLDAENRIFEARNDSKEFLNVRDLGLRSLCENYEKYSAIFKSLAISLCFKTFKDGSLKNFILNLKNNGQVERATFLAVLLECKDSNVEELFEKSLHKEKLSCQNECLIISLRLFIQDLKQPELSLNQDHRRDIAVTIESFSNPYLRSLFKYFIFKKDSIKEIIGDDELILQDRIAISVYYFNDKPNDLLSYFDLMIDQSVRNANLQAITITGLSNKVIDLFQAFLDKTDDIQTVALIIIHSPFEDVINNQRVKAWIEDYRKLLNKWDFMTQRAEYDVFKMKLYKSNLSNNDAPYESFSAVVKGQLTNRHYELNNSNFEYGALYCNNCGKNIVKEIRLSFKSQVSSLNASAQNQVSGSRHMSQQQINHPAKMQADSFIGCPKCGKFLPRCTICLRYMTLSNQQSNINTISRYQSIDQSIEKSNINDSQIINNQLKISSFFSWCQSCKHGGHMKHITEWFKDHKKCAFPHCKCECMFVKNLM